ncbi:MAG TPA: hypothetical protein VEG30_04740 [Terriglobales bacterium]|nr:hypothetical protein [Terriglobales bacterium]
MKIMNRMMFTLGVLTLLAASGYAEDRMVANVPFDFTAEGHEFAAGRYYISQMSDGSKVLAIRNDANNDTIFVHTFSGDSSGETKLSFNRYGETYFLESVSTRDAGYELGRSQAEKKLRASTKGTETIVAALGQ